MYQYYLWAIPDKSAIHHLPPRALPLAVLAALGHTTFYFYTLDTVIDKSVVSSTQVTTASVTAIDSAEASSLLSIVSQSIVESTLIASAGQLPSMTTAPSTTVKIGSGPTAASGGQESCAVTPVVWRTVGVMICLNTIALLC